MHDGCIHTPYNGPALLSRKPSVDEKHPSTCQGVIQVRLLRCRLYTTAADRHPSSVDPAHPEDPPCNPGTGSHHLEQEVDQWLHYR